MRDGCTIWKNLPTTLQNIIYYLLQKADPPISFSKNKIDYISWKLDEMSTLIEVNGLIYGTVCGELDWNDYETDEYKWTTSPETHSGKSDPDPVAYIVASILSKYVECKDPVKAAFKELPLPLITEFPETKQVLISELNTVLEKEIPNIQAIIELSDNEENIGKPVEIESLKIEDIEYTLNISPHMLTEMADTIILLDTNVWLTTCTVTGKDGKKYDFVYPLDDCMPSRTLSIAVMERKIEVEICQKIAVSV